MEDTLAGQLTHATGNRVDFYNIAGLAKQRTKDSLWGLWNHYTWRELFIRGGIILATALTGIVAANSCKDEECSGLLRGVTGASLGFFVSHAIAVIPTIRRRSQLIEDRNACHQAIVTKLAALRDTLAQSEHLKNNLEIPIKIAEVALECVSLKLAVTKRGDAVNNLIIVKKLMHAIEDRLDSLMERVNSAELDLLDTEYNFWQQPITSIREQLLTQPNGEQAGSGPNGTYLRLFSTT